MPFRVSLRVIALLSLLGVGVAGFAGNLDAPAAPSSPGSAMFTIEDLYNRLATGTAGSKRSGPFVEPGTAPGSTMHTLNDLMNMAPALDNANGAGAGDVLTGKTFWGLPSGSWGPRVGAMPNRGAVMLTPGAATQTIAAGYHNGSGQVVGDANLTSGNIKAGATIFGVVGDNSVVNTTSGNATAGEILTGRKAWANGSEVTGTMPDRGAVTLTPGAATQTIPAGYHNGSGQVVTDPNLVSGNIRAGQTIFGVVGSSTVVDTSPASATAGEILLDFSAYINGVQVTGMRAGGVRLTGGAYWPGGHRWYKPGDGTVIDCMTGLVWLSNVPHVERPYLATDAAELDCMRWLYSICHGQYGLTDGSQPGDWDMPTIAELRSLLTDRPPGQAIGSLTSHAFDNPYLGDYYWTSTPVETGYTTTSADQVRIIYMRDGSTSSENKSTPNPADWHYVWPIRRGFRW